MTDYEPSSGSIVHVELYSDGPDETRAFLEDTFGWTFEVMEEMDYMSFTPPSPPGGGIMLSQEGPFTPPPVLYYIAVDDVEATGEAVTEAGGELLVEGMEVPGMGIFTIFREPGGVVEAAWEERYEGEPSEGGFPLFTDEPAPGSITHFELYTEDVGATRAFHEAVFGWEFEELEEGEYTMARPPTPPYGGLMPATGEMPAGSLLYLLVEDAADAVGTIEDAGGSILRDPFDVEGWGTMAVFQVPGGPALALWESVAAEADADAPEPATD